MAKRDKTSLNAQVKQQLLALIRNVAQERNGKLPPELEFARKLGVSRPTIRTVLDELEQEGLILRIHGKGTFINPEALNIKLSINPGFEFNSMIQKSGFSARVEVIRFEEIAADEHIASILGLKRGAALYLTEKAYFADDHPAIVSLDYFPKGLFPRGTRIDADDCKNSIFQLLLDKAGRSIVRDRIEIEAVETASLSAFSAFAHRLECASALLFRGINYDQTNKPVIYDMEIYDTRFIRFNLLRLKSVY